jgi:hypothetical protein
MIEYDGEKIPMEYDHCLFCGHHSIETIKLKLSSRGEAIKKLSKKSLPLI